MGGRPVNAPLAIIAVSLAAALALTGFFAFLCARRWYLEWRLARQQASMALITRHYLQRINGHAPTAAPRSWNTALRLAAVSHLHLLLRGGDRQQLMQMAELDGLLRAALARSHALLPARRIDAVRLLQQFGGEACIARLRAMLARDPHAKVRLEAAFALAALDALPPPREFIRLLGMFERPANRLDSALLRAAAPHYSAHLRTMLDDPATAARRALFVDALGYANDLAILPAIEDAARARDPEVRSAALRAAARIGHPGVAEWVEALLNDPAPFVRVQAANCCAALGLLSAVPRLRERSHDPDLWVRLRCEHALDVLVAHWPHDDAFGAAA